MVAWNEDVDSGDKLASTGVIDIGTEVGAPRRQERLGQAMRWAGGMAILLAAAVNLLQGLQILDSGLRIYGFIGLVIALLGLGLLSGLGLGDTRLARSFLGLGAALGVVPFFQFGAMTYATTEGLSGGPGLLQFGSTSIGSLLLAGLATTLVGGSTIYAGLSVLAKEARKPLTALCLALCGLGVVPSRDPAIIGLVILLGLWGTSAVIAITSRRQALPATFESIVAVCISVSPLIVIAARGYLGQMIAGNSLPLAPLNVVVGGVLSYFLIFKLPLLKDETLKRMGVEGHDFLYSSLRACGLVLAGVAWFSLCDMLLFDAGNVSSYQAVWYMASFGKLDPDYLPMVIGMPFCIGSLALATTRFRVGWGEDLLGAVGCVFIALITEVSIAKWLMSTYLLVASMVLTMIAIGGGSQLAGLTSLFIVPLALRWYLSDAISLLTVSPWLTLTAFGIVTLLCSTLVERSNGSFRGKLRKTLKKFKWS